MKTVRQINWPVLIGTAIVVAVGAVGAYFLREHQVHRTAQSYWDRALTLEAQGAAQQAADYLFLYTRFRPNDAPARVKLAQVFDQISDDGERKWRAVELYYEALGFAREGERLALRRRLAELLLETNQLSLAKAQTLEIRDALRGDRDGRDAHDYADAGCDDPDAERILAEVAYRQYVTGVIGDELVGRIKIEGTLVGGKTIVEVISHALDLAYGRALDKSLALNPLEMHLAEMLADVHRGHPELFPTDEASQQGERDAEADRIMAKLVAGDPENPEFRLANYRYRRRYNLPDADEELNKALELGPEVFAVRLAAAEHLRRKAERLLEGRRPAFAEGGAGPISDEDPEELFAQAREHLEYILDGIDPRNESAHLALGDVYSAEGRSDEAKLAWTRGLESVGNTALSLNIRMAEALANENDPKTLEHLRRLDRSLDALRPTVSAEVKNSLTRTRDLIQALWLLRQEKFARAIPLLAPIAAEGHGLGTQYADSLKALQMLAQAHRELEQWEEAAQAYESAAALAPDDWRFRLNAAAMWQAAGRPRLAISHLRRVAPIVNTPDAWMALARGHYDATMRRPKQERDWEPFQKALAKTREASRGAEMDQPWLVDLLEANYQVVTAADEQLGRARAIAILQRVDEDHPRDDIDLCSILASAYERLGESARADECLRRLARLTPDSHVSYLKRAEVLARRKEYDSASQTLTDAIEQLPAKEQLPLQRALVQLALARGEFDAAEARLVKLHDANRDDPQPVYLLLELALRRGKLDEAAEWESTLRRTEGRLSTLGRFYKIWRLVDSAVDVNDPRLSLAEREQTLLSRERQNWSLTHFAAALVHEKRGRFAKASDALETAVQLGDGRASTYERLVRALSIQGRFVEADAYLKRLEQQIPNSNRLSSLAILVAARMDDVERAGNLARDGVEHRPQDPLAWLWLGQVLLAQQKHQEAEQACRKAMQLAPGDVRMWNGLFSCYYRTGREEEASEMLAELPKLVDLPPGDLAFVQAQGYELLGDRQAAGEHYAGAVKIAPDHFPLRMRIARFYLAEDATRAEKALRKALEINPTSGPARRMLAAILASDPTRWEEASRLLGEGGDTADKRVQAALFAMRQSGDRVADLEDARRILEGLVLRATNPTDEDRLLLALVYAELSKVQLTTEARETLVNSATSQFRPLLVGRARPNQSHLAVYIRFLLDGDDDDNNNLEEARRWLAVWERENTDSLLFASLKARWLHGAGEEEKIEPLVESVATRAEENLDTLEERLKLYSSVGQIYSGVENHLAAQRWFDRLASADTERFGPLAMSLAAQDRHVEAVKLCLRSAESDDSPRPALVLAAVLLDASDYQPPEEVELLLATALKNHPRDTSLLTAVANLRFVQGDASAAIARYRRILELRPNDPVILNNLATLLAEEEGRSEEALGFIDRAIKFTGPRPPLLDTKGTILLRAGRLEEAIAVLEMAAGTPRADPRYRFHLAVALDEQAKDPARAKSELQAALDGNLTSTILTPVDRADLAALRQKYSI